MLCRNFDIKTRKSWADFDTFVRFHFRSPMFVVYPKDYEFLPNKSDIREDRQGILHLITLVFHKIILRSYALQNHH